MKDLFYILRAFFMGGSIMYRAEATSVKIDRSYSFMGSCKVSNHGFGSYCIFIDTIDGLRYVVASNNQATVTSDKK